VHATQPVSLRLQPILEASIADADALQQVAGSKRAGPLQRVRRPVAHQPLELGDVDRKRGRIEPDREAVRRQRRRPLSKALPDPRQGMLQAVTRLRLSPIAPQQAGQLVTRLGRSSGQGKNRE
jgi:hypothetical protein